MTKEQAFDILKDAFNEFILNAVDDFAGAYQQFSIKTSGTFVESGNALDGQIPDLPA
jgi:hypothetical protein